MADESSLRCMRQHACRPKEKCMVTQKLSCTMLSPLPVYLDEAIAGLPLALRPETLNGRVVGLLPNWRPSAVKLLHAVGQLLKEHFQLQAVVMEQPARELPQRTGGLIDAMGNTLDSLATQVDVVITATGD
jgi:hypothetical protein